MVFGVGTFLFFLGVAYSQAGFCYGRGPCMHQGLLGIADFLVYNFGLNPTSMGVLVAAIGVAITVVGLRSGRTGYLQGAGILAFVASMLTFLLMAGGVVQVFAAVEGNMYCGFGASLCSLSNLVIITVISTAGFALGVAASVSSMMGRYHVVVPIGIVMLMASSVVALVFSLATFVSFMAPALSLCMVSLLFVILSKGGLLISTTTPLSNTRVDQS